MPTNARKIAGYSDISEAVLAQESIIRTVANTETEGTPGYTTVKVYVHELATIADYNPGTGVSITTDSSSYVTIDTTKEKGINEILDGYTVETAPTDLVARRLEAALAKMGEQMDTDALLKMGQDSQTVAATKDPKPTVSTIYKDILGIKQKLDEAKAPRRDRFLLLTPEMENLLLDQDAKVILNTTRGDEIIANGWVGRLLGFDIYSTVLMHANINMMALQKRAFAFREGWKVGASVVSLDQSAAFYGDSAIKGRMAYVYGAVRPTLIFNHSGAA